MTSHFPQKLYIQLLISLFYVWLTYSSCHAMSELNNNVTQCVESERQALLKFKQGIRVDHCRLLDSWVEDHDCCKWRGIHCNSHSGHVTSLSLPGIPRTSYDYLPCLEGTISVTLTELKHLKYLDLSCNNFTGQFPKFIGSLTNLERLNLSNVGFMGYIPQEIGNLSRLSSLDLNCRYERYCHIHVKSLHWLSRLRLLRYLDLGYINLSAATHNWLSNVNSLPFLKILHLDSCQLSLTSPYSLSYTNSSSTLNFINLSDNNFNASIFKWFFNLTGLDNNLVYLDLSYNALLFGNNILVSEYAMKFIGSLCSLQHLDLSGTNFNYDLSGIIQLLSACPNKALEYLGLNSNNIWGSIPDNVVALSSLKDLNVFDNQLNGTISEALGRLSMLETLDLSANSLNGVLTGAHLSNLSKLVSLAVESNIELVVNISANWIPPFQLHQLFLSSCKVGPEFPMWLLTQKNLTVITLYNASISCAMPVSFLKSLSSKLEILDMSQNMMHGVIPDVSSIKFDSSPRIDLSSNNFTGAIPPFLRNVSELNLSNNNISQGLVPLLCPQTKMPLSFLDLSKNSFSDMIPDCWGYFNQLSFLHLENNKLWGKLPASMGLLDQLRALHLGNNNLSGELPASLVNCTSLRVLDLAHNSLTGYIPPSFCYFPRLRILDISDNHIHGNIPRCIYNLRGMANISNIDPNYPFTDLGNGRWENDEEWITSKRKEQKLDGWYIPLGLLIFIDFSNNMLEGQIPQGISNLIGLISINLSRNHLTGAIPLSIGQLTSLETLDLSHNHLSGEIPSSLAQISFLGGLDLSYNNLSGKIPTGTQLQSFDASFYAGNPLLCGAPLPTCQEDKPPRKKKHDIDYFMLGLYISVILGFIVGFWGVCGSLVLKQSRRHAFFRFFDDLKDRIYVTVVVSIARVWRRP